MELKNYEIRNRYTNDFIFSAEGETFGDVVAKAIRNKASLRHADLSCGDLTYADLRGADLRYADLRHADLRNVDLRHANLRGADLRYACLNDANLSDFQLRPYKHDLWGVLLLYPLEIPGLVKAIKEGNIDRSVYSGIMGTIANCNSHAMLKDADSPADQWFTMIGPGDTPENNFPAQEALQWIEEFLNLIAIQAQNLYPRGNEQ